MHPVERAVYKWMSSALLGEQGNTIIIGCSAGPDSIALVHILHALALKCHFRLIAVYVDHGLRPAEIPGERQLVQQTAGKLGLDAEIVEVAAKSEAKHYKKSLEHAARDLRYAALHRMKEHYQADYIAVGHNADDQVEEVLLRLLRGSSRKALSAMQQLENGILRPLLQLSKQTLLNYLAEQRIPFCHDSSNDDHSFLRNRIRHELLPLLEQKYDPGIRKALLKTAANLAEDEDFLEGQVQQMWDQVDVPMATPSSPEAMVLSVNRHMVSRYHPALQRRLFERILWSIGTPARYEHILAITKAVSQGRSGSELHLSKGLRVAVLRDHIQFSYPRGRAAWRGSLKNEHSRK